MISNRSCVAINLIARVTLSCRHKHVTDVKLDSTVMYLDSVVGTVYLGRIVIAPALSNKCMCVYAIIDQTTVCTIT